MRHDPRPRWHPVLSAHEREPGVWLMLVSSDRHYATVRIVRRDGRIAYRVDAEPTGTLIGHTSSPMDACERVHGVWIDRGTPGAL